MADAPQTPNILSHFHGMQPLKGKVSFVDPNGKVITLKIDDSKSKRKSWVFGSRKKRGQPTEPGEKGYKATISVDGRGTIKQQQAGAAGNLVFHQGDEGYEDIIYPAHALPPTAADRGGYTPALDASSSGSSEEDNYDKEREALYQKLKRRASNGYANVRANTEPLYSSVSKPERPPLPPRDTPDIENAEKTDK